MSNAKKPTILVLTSMEGHVSIARSVEAKLASHYNVVVHSIVPKKLNNMYLTIYQWFPFLYSIPFKMAEYETSMTLIRSFLEQNFGKAIHNVISEVQPDLVVSTYLFFDDAISSECMRRSIPFYTIVTDPASFHPLSITAPATRRFLFDEDALKRAVELLPNIHHPSLVSGWFVRPQFEAIAKRSREAIRKELGMNPKATTLLVCGGSDGTGMILKVLPALFYLNKPLTVAIVCGSNTNLYRAVRNFMRIYKMTAKKSKVSIVPLRFIPDLERYMRASDLVIGKAGPNLLFESVATLTPFLAITHISGQETGNLDLIREYRLGYVQEDTIKAMKLLRSIIRRPSQLKKFEKPLQEMANHNKGSGDVLLSMIGKDLKI